MDEEKKKIDVSKLFERVENADAIAGNALSKANQNFSSINNLQVLIQNISVSIGDLRENIRDIANYIIVERKLEEDRRLDEKFEAQDEQQKKEMLDRAKALGQSPPPTTSQQEEPVTAPKGGFLSGLLKAIAVGGLIALALPLIPVIAPLLLKAMAIGIGAIALVKIGQELIKFGVEMGKKIKEGYDASVKFARETAAKINERINVIKDSIRDFLSEKKKQFLETAGKVINFGKEKIGDVRDVVVDIKDKVVDKAGKIKDKVVEKTTKFVDSAKDKFENVIGGTDIKERGVKGIIGGVADFATGGIFDFDKRGDSKFDEFRQSNLEKAKNVVVDKIKEGRKNIFGGVQKVADQVTGNVFDFDKSGEGTTGPLRVMTGIADQVLNRIGIESDLDRRGTDTGGSLNKPIVQADPPFQSGAPLMPTASPIRFVKAIDNSQLSISKHNNLPPEIAKLIS